MAQGDDQGLEVIVCSRGERGRARRLRRQLLRYRDRRPGQPQRPFTQVLISAEESVPLPAGRLDALRRARTLIVLCSPRSAVAPAVDLQLRRFCESHDAAHIHCLLVDGEPNVGGARECFAPALRALLDAEAPVRRAARQRGMPEPIAADARRRRHGDTRAHLKLIAALLGVSLDSLQQREAERQGRRLSWASSAAALLLGMVGVAAIAALHAEHRSLALQAEAEELVEFMLATLHEQLEGMGRVDLSERIATQSMAYYTEQPLAALDDEATGRRARALVLIGKLDFQRRDLDSAQAAFSAAHAATARLLAQQPDDQQARMAHVQSLAMLSYVAFVRGELDSAEQWAERYLHHAQRLVAAQPDALDAHLERHDAIVNLGEIDARRGELEAAVARFDTALALARALVERDPDAGRSRLLLAHSRLASVLQPLGRRDEAEAHLRSQLALEDARLETHPQDAQALDRRFGALAWLASLARERGDIAEAHAHCERALALTAQLLRRTPADAQLKERRAILLTMLAELQLVSGEPGAMQAPLDEAQTLLEQVLARDDGLREVRRRLVRVQLLRVEQALAQRRPAHADRLAVAVLAQVGGLAPGDDARLRETQLRALQVAAEAAQAVGDDARARGLRHSALAGLGVAREDESASLRELRAVLLWRLGDGERAERHVAALRAAGVQPLHYARVQAAPGAERVADAGDGGLR